MKLLKLIPFFAVLIIAGFSVASERQKAKTIDDLAKMYDVSTCKACHTKIYDEWEKSIHARSLIGTGRTAATIRTMIQDGLMKEQTKSGVKEIGDIKLEHMMTCAKCHLPQLKNATDEVAQQLAKAIVDGDMKTLEKVNINCLVCHHTNAIIHKWHDGEPGKGVVYGSKDGPHPDEVFPKMRKSVVMKESAMCGQCHGLGPNFDLPQPIQCATLYGSYLHAYVPAGGTETCQDCHIKKQGKGHLMPAYRDPDIAKWAVTMEVSTLSYKFLPKAGDTRPTTLVTVKLTNNAGHRIPDGWPSPNRLVLDVTGKTPDGKEIFKAERIYMPQSTASRGSDEMVYGPFRKVGIIWDTSLQPLQTKAETFEILFPYEEVAKEPSKPKVGEIRAKEMEIIVELWYLPAGIKGEVGKDQFLFDKAVKKVSVK